MNRDNRDKYLIKTEVDSENKFDKDELFNILRSSSALLSGLESIRYTDKSIKSIGKWVFPKKFKKLKDEKINEIRQHFDINVSGEDILPPVSNFPDMKFPEAIIKALKKMKIEYPSPVQMQGIPIM